MVVEAKQIRLQVSGFEPFHLSEKHKLRLQVSELNSQIRQLQQENNNLKREFRELHEEYLQVKKAYNLHDPPFSAKQPKSSGIYEKVFR